MRKTTMLSIRIKDGSLRTHADRYQLEINLRTALGALMTGAGKHLFDLPFDAKVIHAGGTTQVVLPFEAQIVGTVATLSSGPVGPWAGQNLRIIHSSWQERDRRARISAQAAPNLIMDADAFCMYSHWLEPTYLNTAIMGTQTIGYTEIIHDGVRLSDKTMATLGKLARLSAQRPWGQPEFVEYGHWRLWHKGRIVGETFGRKALMLFTDETKGHVLTFEDAEVKIQTYGRKIKGVSPVPARLVIDGDRVCALWQGGQIYELIVEEIPR